MRCKVVWLGFLSFLLLFNVSSSSTSPAESTAPQKSGMYHGAGSCAASACHGSVQSPGKTRVLQTEFSTWIGQDKHSGAYTVLSNGVSQRMYAILKASNSNMPGLGNSAADSPKCLACHSLYVPQDLRAQPFGLEDGVSCESCHGPSSGWLETHIHPKSHADSVQKGMKNLRDLTVRTQVCLTCHVGSFEEGKVKYVDHEMIAAGHPDLMFELTYFSYRMPQHWKLHADEDEGPWFNVKAWGVGQAVQLRDSLNRLAARAGNPDYAWPEYAELDCYACHHSLTAAADSWRLSQKDPNYYAGRRPGNPPYNESRVIVFKQLVEELHPDTAKQLNKELWDVANQMNKLNGNRKEIADTATRAAQLANQLADQLNGQSYDAALTMRLMRRIAANYPTIANAGYGAAAQAAMTLDDLSQAYAQNGGQMNSGLSASIDSLNKLFKEQNPSAYSATQFSERMQSVSKALGVQPGSASGSN